MSPRSTRPVSAPARLTASTERTLVDVADTRVRKPPTASPLLGQVSTLKTRAPQRHSKGVPTCPIAGPIAVLNTELAEPNPSWKSAAPPPRGLTSPVSLTIAS